VATPERVAAPEPVATPQRVATPLRVTTPGSQERGTGGTGRPNSSEGRAACATPQSCKPASARAVESPSPAGRNPRIKSRLARQATDQSLTSEPAASSTSPHASPPGDLPSIAASSSIGTVDVAFTDVDTAYAPTPAALQESAPPHVPTTPAPVQADGGVEGDGVEGEESEQPPVYLALAKAKAPPTQAKRNPRVAARLAKRKAEEGAPSPSAPSPAEPRPASPSIDSPPNDTVQII